jgi:hypothetical protein
MGQIAEMIVTGGRRVRGFADALLEGIAAERFARKPVADGAPINTNHPAWVFGHLALYPGKALQFLGQSPANASVPESWAPLFQPGSECKDDAERAIYPAMEEIVAAYRRTYDAALGVIETLDDAVFATPIEVEPYKQFMPTAGVGANSLMNAHVGFHLGQVSTWRRCMGMGSVT